MTIWDPYTRPSTASVSRRCSSSACGHARADPRAGAVLPAEGWTTRASFPATSRAWTTSPPSPSPRSTTSATSTPRASSRCRWTTSSRSTRRPGPPASRWSAASRRPTSRRGPSWCAASSWRPGCASDDVAQIAFGYGMFTGGFGLHYGLQRAGASVIPISAGNTARQIQFLRDFGTTVLISTPSYALYIGETSRRWACRGRTSSCASACSARRRAARSSGRRSRSRLPMTATDNYGLTEIIGPGVAGECECRDGMHIAEDHFIVECLDPATGAAGGATERWASSCSPPSRASARRCCGTARATSARSRTRRARVAAPWRAWARSWAAPTTCSSSAA